MSKKAKKEELIKAFFEDGLSDKDKEQFLKKAASDKQFVCDFIDELQKEFENEEKNIEEEEGDSD